MKILCQAIAFCMLFYRVASNVPLTPKLQNYFKIETNQQNAHISPELINEFKDFKNLIPAATIDEIVAKHLLLDGNFRTALKYLESEEFTQLQKQLLDIPEIIDVLEFLHLIEENATTSHMGTSEMPTRGSRIKPSLDEYNDGAVTDSYKSNDKMTTSAGRIIAKPQTMTFDNAKEEAVNNLKVPKRPQKQFYITEENSKNVVGLDADDAADERVNANSIAFNEQQPLVHIVLLEDLEVKAKVSNKGQEQHHQHHHHHHNKYQHRRHNSYHHSSLGTFTSFVEEVLQHLPNSAYQNMIIEKCQKNTKFAQFYHALRSPAFKPYMEELKTKPNVQKIISTFSAHGIDFNSLQPVLFKVISWGPNI